MSAQLQGDSPADPYAVQPFELDPIAGGRRRRRRDPGAHDERCTPAENQAGSAIAAPSLVSPSISRRAAGTWNTFDAHRLLH